MGPAVVASLQVLAARVVQGQLAWKLERVVDEETAEFKRSLQQLREGKESRIKVRQGNLLHTSVEAVHLQELIGSYFAFCEQCNTFFEIDQDPSCSVENCKTHMVCPCQEETVMESTSGFYDNFRHRWVRIRWEQPTWDDSRRAENECWICDSIFCKSHFLEHYEACREKVSFRCGFRPKEATQQEPYLRVFGHCGKDVRASNNYHFCEHWNTNERGSNGNPVQCGTLICGDCAEPCNDGCAGFCQLSYPSRCSEIEF